MLAAVVKFIRNGVPPPEIAVSSPEVVAAPAPLHHLALPCSQLIFEKIIEIVATRCHILRLNAPRSIPACPRPCTIHYSAPKYGLAEFKGPTSKGRKGREGKWKGREDGREGGEEM